MENKGKLLGETETIIVGGGQAGLSVGRYLKEHKRPFIILEKNEEIGSAWKERYDSLTLDSFAKYGQLEGFPFPGDPMRHPTKDEVVKYLNSFAEHFGLHPEFATEVKNIERQENKFVVNTSQGFYKSKFIVLATGPFQKPYIPELAKGISPGILQLHSRDYRNSLQLVPGSILVVGGGNSGAEIAEELASEGKIVMFSYRKKFRSVESTPFSQWLAYRLGLAHIPNNTFLGKLVLWYTKGKSVGVDAKSLLKNPKIKSVGEFLEVKNGEMIFTKARIRKIGNIVWATGYQSDFSVVSMPGFEPKSQKRGITNIPGLFLLNIRWQYSKSSSHLAGISRDAKYIASKICRDILKNRE